MNNKAPAATKLNSACRRRFQQKRIFIAALDAAIRPMARAAETLHVPTSYYLPPREPVDQRTRTKR
jgi:hypothetical protein